MPKIIGKDHIEWIFRPTNGIAPRPFVRRDSFMVTLFTLIELLLEHGNDSIISEHEEGVIRRLAMLPGPQPHSFRVCSSGQRIVHVLYERIRRPTLESGDNVIGIYEPTFD